MSAHLLDVAEVHRGSTPPRSVAVEAVLQKLGQFIRDGRLEHLRQAHAMLGLEIGALERYTGSYR